MDTPARRFVFAAHDSGGANILKTLAGVAAGRGHRLAMFPSGPGREVYRGISVPGLVAFEGEDEAALRACISDFDPHLIVTGTSVLSEFERTWWKIGAAGGVPSLAIVDAWGNFEGRFGQGASAPPQPDAVAVIDDWCRDEMRRRSWCKARVHVVGQPHLEAIGRRLHLARRHRAPQGPLLILYASHPVTADWGGVKNVGFDEFTVAEALLAALAGPSAIRLVVKPHPREDAAGWTKWLKTISPPSNVAVELGGGSSEDWLLRADGVVSMFSTVLSEAASSGIPAMSLQPGRTSAINAGLDHMLGVEFVTDLDMVRKQVAAFVNRLRSGERSATTNVPFEGSTARMLAVLEAEAKR